MAALPDEWQHRKSDLDDRVEIDIEYAAIVLHGERIDHGRIGDGRVIHQNIEAPHPPGGGLCQSGNRFTVDDIHLFRPGAVQFRGNTQRGVALYVGNANRGTLRGETPRDRLAYSVRAAGYKGCAPGKFPAVTTAALSVVVSSWLYRCWPHAEGRCDGEKDRHQENYRNKSVDLRSESDPHHRPEAQRQCRRVTGEKNADQRLVK